MRGLRLIGKALVRPRMCGIGCRFGDAQRRTGFALRHHADSPRRRSAKDLYARLVRGKETLVKAYLTLPASLPKCAGTSGDIKIVGASLTMRNGTTPLVTVSALPDAVGALVTSKSTMKNQYADPKFVVQGSQVPPSGSASQQLHGELHDYRPVPIQGPRRSRLHIDSNRELHQCCGSPISRVVEGPTKALRILAVPGLTALDSTMTSTLQASLTALSGNVSGAGPDRSAATGRRPADDERWYSLRAQ